MHASLNPKIHVSESRTNPVILAYHYFYYTGPTLGTSCCMVLLEEMLMQGECVERDKTSSFTASILYLTLGN